jgi:hypothetical protein
MSREIVAVAVLVWLVGALVGWCAGWVARTDQHRQWHRGLRRELEGARVEIDQLRALLAGALDELECAQVDSGQIPRTPPGYGCRYCPWWR